MMKIANKQTRRKALVAMIFAGGILNSKLPARSEELPQSTDLLVQQIAENSGATHEIRAFYLLLLARGYLSGNKRSEVEVQYKSFASLPTASRFSKNWQSILVSRADSAAREAREVSKKPKIETQPNLQSELAEKSLLADKAVDQAMRFVENSSDKFAKLNEYFIASRLYQQLGNKNGEQKCNKVLETAFQDC